MISLPTEGKSDAEVAALRADTKAMLQWLLYQCPREAYDIVPWLLYTCPPERYVHEGCRVIERFGCFENGACMQAIEEALGNLNDDERNWGARHFHGNKKE